MTLRNYLKRSLGVARLVLLTSAKNRVTNIKNEFGMHRKDAVPNIFHKANSIIQIQSNVR